MERKNKNLYLIEIALLKFLPIIISIIYFIGTLLFTFDINVYILTYLSGMSVLPLIFMYVSSYVFKFCEYHRMFLHYITFNLLLNCIDWYVGLPLTNKEYCSAFLLISCVFLFVILYLYFKFKK